MFSGGRGSTSLKERSDKVSWKVDLTIVLPKPPDWGDWLHVCGYWFLETSQDWQPPADLLRFIADGPAPVYVGFGSMVDSEAVAVTRIVIEALRLSGQRGILLGGWAG
jgi:sterol 3beta-glucosyltransferase